MELKAKKSLGQHFLRSEKALSLIVDAGDIHADDLILEIGPGEGVLTKKLLPLAKKVIVVEKDKRSVELITEKFNDEIVSGKLDILEKDVLKFDPEYLKYYKSAYKIIANIPYYITGAIFEHFLESRFQPELMVFLVQKEVAERIVARDGKESILSISIKVFGNPKIISRVPRGAFAPAPKVDSAILLIDDISRDKLEVTSKFFFKVLRAGFAHKRKYLLRNLEEVINIESLQEIFKRLKMNEKMRAEDLPALGWIKLSKEIFAML